MVVCESLAQYVDYGNCEHVTDSTLVLLTGDLAEMPPLAMHCRLDGLVGVRRDEEPQLYAQAMSHVQNILRDQLVLVQRKKATTLSTHFLTRCFVPGTGIDLAQELLIKGYAKALELQVAEQGPKRPNLDFLSRARLEELKRVYGDFLGTSSPSPSEDSPEVLGQQLAQHKAERADDFRKKREDADSARGHFVDALQMLQQAVQSGTSIPGADGRRFSLGYLEACLSNLHHSIQAELAACNLALSADKSPLARLVWRVHNLLTMYLERASSRSVVQCQHTALLEELRPLDWDASQCMAQAAMEAKRLLRKLKSRLRHRLADLEDLESGDEEERQRVTEEIAKLRQEVQVALSQEEYLLDRLALEQCKHFPELDLLFPDLQLSLHQKYAGLLKSNWELSSFELEGSTLQTRFLAEKMLLRECAIDSPESKELLLSRTASYARVSCKHLLRIRAAFLSKNERHVYLLVPRPAPSLSEQRCAPRHAQKALEHVLRALHELHKATGGPIAHGAVHPEMVLFDDQSEEAVLDLPLWTLRSGRSLLPSLDGIDFVAPEQRGGPFCRPSPEGDMYSLGCLALWMLFPGTSFKQTPAGIPDISVLESVS
ncbi:conserved hypothetical protein [Ixodes scapularis]|uniref:Protein kinase domain-containing protein n=1 Tax=Ixodes scapularis TaxID=6945 RepID=B7P875_IXOSC|nr:conserved hypothetical protein [Ixodes scapularis]|eukprot:XP_002401568.1 conserved hypothetical protein [Ixodes scapularis]